MSHILDLRHGLTFRHKEYFYGREGLEGTARVFIFHGRVLDRPWPVHACSIYSNNKKKGVRDPPISSSILGDHGSEKPAYVYVQ